MFWPNAFHCFRRFHPCLTSFAAYRAVILRPYNRAWNIDRQFVPNQEEPDKQRSSAHLHPHVSTQAADDILVRAISYDLEYSRYHINVLIDYPRTCQRSPSPLLVGVVASTACFNLSQVNVVRLAFCHWAEHSTYHRAPIGVILELCEPARFSF